MTLVQGFLRSIGFANFAWFRTWVGGHWEEVYVEPTPHSSECPYYTWKHDPTFPVATALRKSLPEGKYLPSECKDLRNTSDSPFRVELLPRLRGYEEILEGLQALLAKHSFDLAELEARINGIKLRLDPACTRDMRNFVRQLDDYSRKRILEMLEAGPEPARSPGDVPLLGEDVRAERAGQKPPISR